MALELRVDGEAVGEFCRVQPADAKLDMPDAGVTGLRLPPRSPAVPHRALLLGSLFLVELVFFGETECQKKGLLLSPASPAGVALLQRSSERRGLSLTPSLSRALALQAARLGQAGSRHSPGA